MNELWKTIDEFPNYEVSDKGRVRNKRTGRILKPVLDMNRCKNPWPQVTLYTDCKQRVLYIHRLVAIAFLGDPPPSKPTVNHTNGIKTDNKVENLEWMSNAENTAHAIRLGLFVGFKGETNPSARLTEKQVRLIRELLRDGISKRKLADRFGVSQSAIASIGDGSRWSHLKD